jgi:hypothetical protein
MIHNMLWACGVCETRPIFGSSWGEMSFVWILRLGNEIFAGIKSRRSFHPATYCGMAFVSFLEISKLSCRFVT